LRRGAWAEARTHLAAALAAEETAEALEAYALASCWLEDDSAGMIDARERAFRPYSAGGTRGI
jgi:hypothetical protein